MAIYSVMIRGENFPARILADECGPVGFYATRIVEAENANDAETSAVEMLREEFRPLVGERGPNDADARMFLDEIEELNQMPVNPPATGATWFPMEA